MVKASLQEVGLMANQQHVDVLKQGVEAWNKWREEHPNIKPDLRGANLVRINLFWVRFSEDSAAVANLANVDFSNAVLSWADLAQANLTNTNLNKADIGGAQLFGANLTNTNLSEAWLTDTNLSYTYLKGTIFTQANLNRTLFINVDLREVQGLETVQHHGPSTIDIGTIYRSQGKIPERFLRDAGIPDTFLDYMHSLVGSPIEYYSCFISYSSKDEMLAKRLYADLQSNNVRCWFAPEDLKWGEKINTGIDEAIRLHDKLLLILSKRSVASGWVEHEVKTALARERKEKRTVLFPVRVDQAIFDSSLPWTTEIRQKRNIGDFTQWKDHDAYKKAFDRLLRDLKQETQ